MLFRHALYQLSYGGIDDTCGTRTHILRLRAGTPDQLEEGAIGDGYGDRTHIASLKGMCPDLLDESAVFPAQAMR